jgi:hypothetical protein
LQRATAEPRLRRRLLADQLQEDLHLRAVVLVAGDDSDRVRVQDLQQLLI